MRRIQGVNVEIRAVGLPRPAEPALGAALAGITAIDGAATDRAIATLRAAGARKGLVNLGGDLVAAFGEPLVVAVPDPRDVALPRWASFRLQEAALGRASGAEGATGTLAVTAVARSAAEAGALAAEALPLAPGEALALLLERGAAGLVQVREGDERVIVTTPGFGAAHDLQAEAGVQVRP
jgi:thiamine biosynthesis lipoprotein ApbE